MSIDANLSSHPHDSEDDALAQIEKLLINLNGYQLTALKAKIDTATANTTSPFLNLPPEIRILVYKHYFNLIDDVIRVKRCLEENSTPGCSPEPRIQGVNSCTSILSVCRLLHIESKHLFQQAVASRKWRFCMGIYRTLETVGTTRRHSPRDGYFANIKAIQIPWLPVSRKPNICLSVLMRLVGRDRSVEILCRPIDWSVDRVHDDTWKTRYEALLNAISTPAQIVHGFPRFEDWGIPADVSSKTRRALEHVYLSCDEPQTPKPENGSFKVCIQYRLRGPIDMRTVTITFQLCTAQSCFVGKAGPLKPLSAPEVEALDDTPQWDLYD